MRCAWSDSGVSKDMKEIQNVLHGIFIYVNAINIFDAATTDAMLLNYR